MYTDFCVKMKTKKSNHAIFLRLITAVFFLSLMSSPGIARALEIQVTSADIIARAREYGNAANQYILGYEGQPVFCAAVNTNVPAYDCSGFIYTVFDDLGASSLIGAGRMSSGEYYTWFKDRGLIFTDPSLLQPGDLVYYCTDECGTKDSTSDHMALYVGGQGIIHTWANHGLCGDIQETGMSPTQFGSYDSKYSREPYAFLRVPYPATPVVFVYSVTRANENPTKLDSVDFTVTFSEPVTGLDLTDFSLTTSGVSDSAVSGFSGSGSTYTVTVSTGRRNGSIGLNIVNDGTIKDLDLNALIASFTGGETYTVNKSPIFADVPLSHWANSNIESLYNAGVTGGCSVTPLNYCPDQAVTRAEMAVFLLKGMHNPSFTPPDINGSTGFADVTTDYWAAAWIKQLAAEGITGGCGNDNYCPEQAVTRAQMAVFLLKARHGTSYTPPNAAGVFTDVPVGYWADRWIEQLAAEGVTSGCGAGVYCPDAVVTRAQMAVFLTKNFNLP